jgi:ABC-type Fe3+-hydroxamate transport system substrate-binding protein
MIQIPHTISRAPGVAACTATVALILAACGGQAGQAAQGGQAGAAKAAATASSTVASATVVQTDLAQCGKQDRTITDATGTSVVIKGAPSRVVTIEPSFADDVSLVGGVAGWNR